MTEKKSRKRQRKKNRTEKEKKKKRITQNQRNDKETEKEKKTRRKEKPARVQAPGALRCCIYPSGKKIDTDWGEWLVRNMSTHLSCQAQISFGS